MRKSKLKLSSFNLNQEFQEFITETHQFVERKFKESEQSQSHSLEHTIRVANTCLTLGQRLGAKLDILLTAALFHDIGRAEEEKTGQNHAGISALIAEEYLKDQGRHNMIAEVCDAIRSHRFSGKIEPKFREGKILKDADAIDALGTIGLYRVISYSAERNVNMEGTNQHFHDKLLVLSSLMHFKLSKKLAKRKSKVLISFSKGLEKNIKQSKFEQLLKQLWK